MTKVRNYQKDTYYARKAMGCCPKCGKKLPEDYDHITCEVCRAKMRKITAYKAARLTDGQRADINAKARERQKTRRAQMRAEDRCAVCGAPSPDRYLCESCREKRKVQKDIRDGKVGT